MKSATAVLLIVLLSAPSVLAQETPQQTALIHKGTMKIWTGMSLIAAGAFVMPVTNSKGGRSTEDNRSPVLTSTGIGLFFVGGGLAWSGTKDRRKALNPQTMFHVSVGKRPGVEISRRW